MRLAGRTRDIASVSWEAVSVRHALLLMAAAVAVALAAGGAKALADTPTLAQMDAYVASMSAQDLTILQNLNPHVIWVAPNGSPTNTGTQNSPIDLATAYTNATLVTPGTLVWITAGTYNVGVLQPAKICGTRNQPIIFRAVAGARATINGSIQTKTGCDHLWWWGVEVIGPVGSGVDTGGGGDGLKFINLFIHDKYPAQPPPPANPVPTDMGVGGWDDNNDCEFYGDIVFRNGWTQLDHGYYSQNTSAHTAKRYVDNIVCENAGEGFQIYGSAPILRNIYFEGNAVFCTSLLARVPGLQPQMNILIGGNDATKPLSCVVVRSNCTYHSSLSAKRGVDIGYHSSPNTQILIEKNYFMCGSNAMQIENASDQITVQNNTFWAPSGMVTVTLQPPGNVNFANNTYIDNGTFNLAQFQASINSGQTDKVVQGLNKRPAGVYLFKRVNRYEPTRIHLMVYNWPKTATVGLDLSDVLTQGQSFHIVEVHDPWGAPVVQGVYNGSPVQMNMFGDYAPEFGAYLLFLDQAAPPPAGTLNVQSTPPTGLSIGSSTGHGGTTNYTVSNVTSGTSVNLQAPAADPAGYVFSQWTVNGTAQTAGQKAVTFTMPATATAVAEYNTVAAAYTLTVQSTPPTGLIIGSSTGHGGTTNYTVSNVTSGTSVNLQAPAADPTGCTFSQWTVNGTAQAAGQKSVTFTMAAVTTAVAQYNAVAAAYTLTVQSTPPTGLIIGSSTGHGGTTNYTVSGVASGTSVNLQAPATDPTGYVFSQWTVNGAAQASGQKAITFTMNAAMTAVAQYNAAAASYALTVQSIPPTGLIVGSSTGHGGTTNYTVSSIASGATVNLQAPAADPTGSTFSQWTVNSAAQPLGQKTISFSMNGATTAVAQYNATCTLTVQSTPPTGLTIGSGSGHGGTTNYTVSNIASGTGVNLQAPATDPPGYVFSQWVVNGTAQTAGQKTLSFTMYAATTAVAQYNTGGTYSLNVQSTPPTGLAMGSSTGHGGTTNYTVSNVATGTSVNLQAPATDPAGHTFSRWTVNGTAQPAGQKAVSFTLSATTTAVAVYTSNISTLTVQSTPPAGVSIGSSTGNGGTTNYTNPVGYGTSVNLQAPAADPTGCTFSKWTVNGAAQPAGQKAITFTMTGATTAVAQYTLNTCTLNVQSTPPTGVVITSSTVHGGTTNYAKTGVGYGASVNLQAPAADPAGYTFSQWTVNGTAQSAGQKAVTFTMAGATTAVAAYTLNTDALTVQSTPPAGLSIGSSTGCGGTTNYTVSGRASGTSINLQAPAANPAGYTFSQWTVNGAAQAPGKKSVTFTMSGATTAVAQYTAGLFVLSVQSTPPPVILIGSSTGHGGTTSYAMPGIGYGTSVNLQAPAADPAGYAFSQWTVNDAAQAAGQKAITFTLTGATTAVAQYTPNTYALAVQSTPPTGIVIASSTTHNGTTNYTIPAVPYGASVNLQAPMADPMGWYTFSQWTLNGAPQAPGQPSLTFAMGADTTAVAQYTVNTCALTVQSQNPGSGVPVTVSPADNNGLSSGTTGFTRAYNAGTSIALTAPWAASGNNFQKWQKNGIDFSTNPAITVTAASDTYTAVYLTPTARFTLSVQSTPAAQTVASSTGHGGTTSYTKTGVGNGTTVNLQAPATDPAGYIFSQWTVNGAAQPPGQKAITFVMNEAVKAVARYTRNAGYALSVQSTPAAKVAIGSSTGHSGTTSYTKSGVTSGTNVNLQAPATDPAGYAFSQWTVNGAAQPLGQKSVTFTMDGAVKAVAQYMLNSSTLTVESAPPAGLSIGSTTGHKGTTNYYKTTGVTSGTTVNLQAPATDPTGYTFSQWTVNGAAQTAGQKSITVTTAGTAVAVAQYTLNGYTLTVKSTPLAAQVIGSSTGHNGVTNYTKTRVGYGTVVNLQAPATDPLGYSFLQWTLNGAPQTPGQKAITLTMEAAVTAVAQYTKNIGYTLSVQSSGAAKVAIASSTGHSGTTNYTRTGLAYGTSVNLQAPAADPVGYSFSQWKLNGAAQPAGQKAITFPMTAATTAVAGYVKVASAAATATSPANAGAGSTAPGASGGQPGSNIASASSSPIAEAIVDDCDNSAAKTFKQVRGQWAANVLLKSANAGSYASTAAVQGRETARVRFSCTVLAAGKYDVYAWWPAKTDAATQAAYEVHHAAGGTTVRVNQSQQGGQWNLIGTFDFDAGSHVVDVHNGASAPGAVVCADAVRFVKAGMDIGR